ncbi:MAG: LysM peptidoglycan-binding domain-containing protein [Lewinellaceae bacterium]|nr:LysM peptidoglycan-binding domain-containing protein [Lewinellaceae bacterium]
MKRLSFIALNIFFLTCSSFGQGETFSFLQEDLNTIINRTALDSFYQKLADLESGKIRKVSIVHIGDSHIQADYMTGRLRYLFQDRYGNAGRGFVFPYRLADSNSPRDIRSSSNIAWESRKSLYQNTGIPLGLAGMAIQTRHPGFLFEMEFKEGFFPQDPLFDKVTLFYQQGHNSQDLSLGYFLPGIISEPAPEPVRKYHTVRSGDTLYGLSLKYGCSVKDLQRWNGMRGTMLHIGKKLIVYSRGGSPTLAAKPFEPISTISTHDQPSGPGYSVCQLDTLMRSIVLKGVNGSTDKNEACLFGMVCENSRRTGILYNAIGVNGATFAHYNSAAYFWDQLPVLEPDLIIVSLGTNESAGKPADSLSVRTEVNLFLANLQRVAPGAPVLITTNPDILKRKRYTNPYGQIVRDILVQTAEQRNLAAWDLYSLMGGLGSMKSWRQAGLSAGDYIHFAQSGYELQADLLFEALISNADN